MFTKIATIITNLIPNNQQNIQRQIGTIKINVLPTRSPPVATNQSLIKWYYHDILYHSLSIFDNSPVNVLELAGDINTHFPRHYVQRLAVSAITDYFSMIMTSVSKIRDAIKQAQLLPLPPITHQSTRPIFTVERLGQNGSLYFTLDTITSSLFSGDIPTNYEIYYWFHALESVIDSKMKITEDGSFEKGTPSAWMIQVATKVWTGLYCYMIVSAGEVSNQVVMNWAYSAIAFVFNEAKPLLISLGSTPHMPSEYLTVEKIKMLFQARMYDSQLRPRTDNKGLLKAHAIYFGSTARTQTGDLAMYYPPVNVSTNIASVIVQPTQIDYAAIGAIAGYLVGRVTFR